MRKRRAARLVEERVDGVSVDDPDADEAVTVRLDADGTWVAAIGGDDSPTDSESDSPTVRLEYVTDGATRARRKATQVRRLLSGRSQ